MPFYIKQLLNLTYSLKCILYINQENNYKMLFYISFQDLKTRNRFELWGTANEIHRTGMLDNTFFLYRFLVLQFWY